MEPRRGLGRHPLARRLPLLVLFALGLWWWTGSQESERELVWRLEGAGWSDIRSLDFQVTAADGERLKRETRAFPHGPPAAVSLRVNLVPGTYDVWVFARGERGASLPAHVEHLTLAEGDVLVERRIRVPVSR